MESMHCPEEIELLKLLKQLQIILAAALDSLGNKKPSTAEAGYLGYAAKSVNTAADGYVALRELGRVDASKLLIRPMLDIVLSASAVMKKKGFLFRKAFTEFDDARKIGPQDNARLDKANKALEELKQRFQQVEPDYPIACKRVDARYTADIAELPHIYASAYRTYCEFTHSAMRAVQGHLNNATDPIDTSMAIWSVGEMLNHLKKYTPAEVPNLSPFDKRLELATHNMLNAFAKAEREAKTGQPPEML
jgi:hypothetical protein